MIHQAIVNSKDLVKRKQIVTRDVELDKYASEFGRQIFPSINGDPSMSMEIFIPVWLCET
ncbi:hypothetical protein YC2023_089331 [Brassica napus]